MPSRNDLQSDRRKLGWSRRGFLGLAGRAAGAGALLI
ncbi:MAG: twin-arginine translocation signal domain-containing protein, partial [Terriglobales bacterium]